MRSRGDDDVCHQLVMAFPVAAVILDGEGKIHLVNRKLTEIFGYTIEDIPTAEDWYLKAYPNAAYRDWVRNKWEKRQPDDRGEYLVTCKDGTEKPAIITAVDVQGLILGTFIDVSDHRKIQATLALSSRLAAMGTLVAGITHEINNPLSVVLSSHEETLTLLKGLIPLLPDNSRLLDAIESTSDGAEGVRRISRIIADLRVFGSPDLTKTKIRLEDVITLAMRWLPATVGKAATISVEAQPVPLVCGSIGQLSQVIVNLVLNAADATKEGQRGQIFVRTSVTAEGNARVTVTDDGVGIPPDVMRRVFEPFYTTKPVGKGTGLGLSISYAIVSAHGGTLNVESEVGRGTTFFLELPPDSPP